MKINTLYFVSLFIILNSIVWSQEKYALLIGVKDYPTSTLWKNLSTQSDVDILKIALLKRGFKEENILTLTDKTNKSDIIGAFNSHLIQKVTEGDVVFFHFSGHGYQIPDDNGDETDGYDEALVPSDAIFDRGMIKSDEFYENYIRDDELGNILDDLREKLGTSGNVMVSIDACHSGTATRGMAPYRGEVRGPRTDREFVNVQATAKLKSDFGITSQKEGLATMACFFGSSEDQLNKEYHSEEIKCGSLSYSISKALAETSPNVSYKALFDQVRTTMSKIVPGQLPHLEGDANQEIFGGKLLKIDPYWSVINVVGKNEVTINAGMLMYLKRGTKVGFYAPDTQNFREATPLASGEIIDVKTIESTVKITEGETDAKKLESAWIYIIDQNFGGQALTVRVLGQNKALKTQFENYIKDYPFITLTNDEVSDVLLEVGVLENKKNNLITVTTREDVEIYQQSLVDTKNLSADSMLLVLRRISDYSQSMFLRTLQVDNYEFDVDVRIIPLKLVDGITQPKRPSDLEIIPDASSITLKEGVYDLPENTFYKLEIINNSSAPLYYSLIEIDPIHEVNVLFPKKGRTAQEYKLNPRSSDSPVVIFKTNSTYGNTVYKLVVTRKPLDLRAVFQTRGVNSRGSGSPFETLLQSTFKEDVSTRSSQEVSMEVEDVGVYTFVYELVKKE